MPVVMGRRERGLVLPFRAMAAVLEGPEAATASRTVSGAPARTDRALAGTLRRELGQRVPPATERRLDFDAPAAPARGRRRVLVAWLPDFAIERVGFEADEVVGLVAELRSATRLVATSAGAAARGLIPGMTAAEARALLPDVTLLPWEPTPEAEDVGALLAAFGPLSDRVSPLRAPLGATGGVGGGEGPLEGIALEVGHTSHLFAEGEVGLLARTREIVDRHGHRGVLVIADDPLAALAIARAGGERDAAADLIVPVGQAGHAIAHLPLEALGASPELVGDLAAVGVMRVSDLARLDAAGVAVRYGAEGLELHTVARGGSTTPRPGGLPPAEPAQAGTRLGGPTETLDAVRFALIGLLGAVSAALAARDEVAVRLAVGLILDRRGAVRATRTVRVRVGRPTRDPARLLAVVMARLEGLALEAPILEVTVKVEEAGPERGGQAGLYDRALAAEPWPELVARLVDALGEAAVFAAEPVARWRPEGAWAPVPFDPEAGPDAPVDLRVGPNGKVDPVLLQDVWEADTRCPRPTLLRPRPEPVEVRVEAGHPAWVRVSGGWSAALRVEGPERLTGEWWAEDGGFDRSYWAVALEEGVAWLFEDSDGRWWHHGWFD